MRMRQGEKRNKRRKNESMSPLQTAREGDRIEKEHRQMGTGPGPLPPCLIHVLSDGSHVTVQTP